MRRMLIAVASVITALILGTTVLAAGAAIPTAGVFWACYDAGGNVKLIDHSVITSCPKGWLGPVSWSQTGPQGDSGPAGSDGQTPIVAAEPAGDACAYGGISVTVEERSTYVCNGSPGESGAAGVAGPRGEPGPVIASIDDLEGVACGSGEAAGQIEVAYGTDAAVTLQCVPALVRLTVRAYYGGTVTSVPPGIDCTGDASCSHLFPQATSVTLSGSPIDLWGGPTWYGACAGSSSDSACQLTLTSEASVTAAFRRVGCEGAAPTDTHGTYTCVNGLWTLSNCQWGWGNCDGYAANGCEADLQYGESCCGMCGRACAPGSTCQGGTCVVP